MFLHIDLHRGYNMLRDGKSDVAAAYFDDLCKKYPRASQPLFERGKLYVKKGDIASARDTFLAVLDHAPKRDVIEGILEMTNWWMISPPAFFNNAPSVSPDGKKLAFCSAHQDTNGDGKIDASDRA